MHRHGAGHQGRWRHARFAQMRGPRRAHGHALWRGLHGLRPRRRRCGCHGRRRPLGAAVAFTQVSRVAPHRAAAVQGVVRHHRHRTRHGLVAVAPCAVRPLRAVHAVVRAAVSVTVIVEAVAMPRRVAIAGYIHLTRRQRHPAHHRAADVDRHAPLRPAHPGHQRRRKHRPRHVRAWHPAPTPVPRQPATVVERCKAPGRFVDPGPAPGPHPGPAAVAVGRPAGAHLGGVPDGTVIGVAVPAAGAVQVFGASHFGRHKTC